MLSKPNFHRRISAFCLLLCFAVVALFAQDYKSLLGKWSMTSETEGDSIPWTLVLKEADGKLTGFLSANDQEIPAKSFTYADGVIKFVVPYEGDEYQIELKPDGDNKLAGTWSGNGNSGRTKGTKQ